MSIQFMPPSSPRRSACELGVVVGMDQDAADEAAAEHQLGDLKTGAAERSIAHAFLPGTRLHRLVPLR